MESNLLTLLADVLAPLQVIVPFHLAEIVNVKFSYDEFVPWVFVSIICNFIVMTNYLRKKCDISRDDVFEMGFCLISCICLIATILFQLYSGTSNVTLYPFRICFGVYFAGRTNAKFMKLMYSIRERFSMLLDKFKVIYLVKPFFIILLLYSMDFGIEKVTSWADIGSLLKIRHVRPTNCLTGQANTTTEPFLNSNVSWTLFHKKTSLIKGETILVELDAYSDGYNPHLLRNNARIERRCCEDVSFNCVFRTTYNATECESFKTQLQTFQWKKNGRFLNNSSKRIHTKPSLQKYKWKKNGRFGRNSGIKMSRIFITEGKMWDINLSFTNTCIEQTDFGNYECVNVVELGDNILERYMRGYVLAALPDCNAPAVSVSIGTPILTSNATTLHVQSNDISIRYTINGKDRNEYLDTCRFTTQIFPAAQQWASGFDSNICILERTSNWIDSLYRPYCPCKEILGVHRISVFRVLEYTPIPFEIHLTTFRVVPEFTPWNNNTSIIKALDLSRLNETTGPFDDVFLDVVQKIPEPSVFYDIPWISLVVALCLHFSLMYVCCVYGNTLYGRSNTTSSSNNEEQTNNRFDQNNFTYDIAISSCEDDDHIVSTWLVPHLERLGFCVYFPSRDVRPGEPELKTIEKAAHQSRKALIVLSENYLNDTRCMEMQLKSLFLEPFYQHEISEEHLVFIQIDGAPVPRHLLRFAKTDVRSMLHVNPTANQ